MRPNTRQRSWSDYVGDKPIKSWVGKSPASPEARFYSDSPVYGPGGSMASPAPEPEDDPIEVRKRTRLRDSMLKLGAPVTSDYNPNTFSA